MLIELLPVLPRPGSKVTSTPWSAAASLASTSSGTVDSTVGPGVGTAVGEGDGAGVDAVECADEGATAHVARAVGYTRGSERQILVSREYGNMPAPTASKPQK